MKDTNKNFIIGSSKSKYEEKAHRDRQIAIGQLNTTDLNNTKRVNKFLNMQN